MRIPLLLSLLLAGVLPPAGAAPLRVCATVPELGSLAREIGGDAVDVTVFVRSAEDPHHLIARPSFVRALHSADAVVSVGLELEVGWLPPLLEGARNSRLAAGQPGFIDTAEAIEPLQVPVGGFDRSHGDVHPGGNPHYLLDPVNGLRVARLLASRFADLRPDDAAGFAARYEDFEKRLLARLLGAELAGKLDPAAAVEAIEKGTLDAHLAVAAPGVAVGGWFGALGPYRGQSIVDDHDMWVYFTTRFGLKVAAHLEPKPGLPPTTRHLEEVIAMMRRDQIRAVFTNAYFDRRHADVVARETGARVASLAHQCGAREGTDDYLAMCDHNVREAAAALAKAP